MSAFEIISGLILWLVIAGLYFIPFIVASKNKEHSNPTGVFILNVFLGWTLIGWVIAFAWAFSKTKVIKESFEMSDKDKAIYKKAKEDILKEMETKNEQ